MAENWVRTHENGVEYIESVNGVSWGDGRVPWWLHRCRPQTRGFMSGGYVERCNCGATRLDAAGPWIERNQTRKARRRKRREDRQPRVQVTCRECGCTYEAATGSGEALDKLCTPCWGARWFIGEPRFD